MCLADRSVTGGPSGVKILNDWCKKKKFSDEQIANDKRLIQGYFKAEAVEKTNFDLDYNGIDYQAVLPKGAVINIDVKRREGDPTKFWKYGEPELPLETYSVKEKEIKGWTLSESTDVDYILFVFAETYYMLPFQLLKRAFHRNRTWWSEKYGITTQESNYYGHVWTSEAIFVPASKVIEAISNISQGRVMNGNYYY